MPTNQNTPQHSNAPDTTPAPQDPADGWGNPFAPPAGSALGTQPATADRPRRRLSPLQKGLVAAGLAVVLAGGAGAAVYAATNTGASSSNSSAVSQAQGGFGAGGSGPDGTGQGGAPGNLGMGGAGQAVHGESVVQSGGQYVTELEQTGTIEAVSASSITLKSVDGYSQTYAISSQTTIADVGAMSGPPQQGQSQGQSTLSASSLTTGQTVRLTALKDGLSAQSIMVAESTGSASGTQNG